MIVDGNVIVADVVIVFVVLIIIVAGPIRLLVPGQALKANVNLISRFYYPIATFTSSSAVLIGVRLNFSTSTFRMFGETKAGSDGPILMFVIPNESKVKRMQTAFCSYHERIIERGNSFTLQLNAFASSVAITIAE